MKRSVLAVSLLTLVITLSACSSQNTPAETDSPVTSSQSPVASIDPNQLDQTDDKITSDQGGQAREIKVEAFSYGFNPNKIEVSKGEKVKLVVTNTGGMHDFVAKDLGISEDLSTSGPTTIEFTPDKAGTFEFICSIGNHAAQGMKGTIVVK